MTQKKIKLVMPDKKYNGIKRLFIDIETCPNIVLSWRIGYNINLSHDNILEERRIICVGYKWEGSDTVQSLAWNDKQDDKRLVQKVIKLLNAADEIVYQNGDRFDLPWIKARAIYHNLKMFPKYKTFDTCKKFKSNFYFNSNKLDYVQKFLGGKGKHETDYQLWIDTFINKDPKALKRMIQYCENDVLELEEVYRKIAPYVVHNIHVGRSLGLPKWSCAHCGSEETSLSKTRHTAMGTIRRQMQCELCHGYYTISDTDYKRFLKENYD